MERVLVTGVQGFVGANLVGHLLVKEGVSEIVGIYRTERRLSPLKILGLRDQVTLVRGDIRDYKFVKEVLAEHRIDTVFHLAAQAIVGVAMDDPVSTFDINVMGTLTLLEACRHYGKIEAFYYQSTDKIYGEGKNVREWDPMCPVEPYGLSKMCADCIARMYYSVYKLPVVVARDCNIFGPGDIHRRIIPNTIRKALRGESPIIFKNYPGVRQYIYIDDAVRAAILLVDRIEETKGKAYNVGTNDVLSQEDVVWIILNHFPGVKPKYVEKERGVREIEEQSMDWSQIREELGWEPKTSFTEGIKKTVDWWKRISEVYPEIVFL